MASRYLVAAGNSNTTAVWATTDGGTPGAAVPTSSDDIFLTATSGAVNLTIAAALACKSLTCTGYVGTVTHNGFAITASGSVLLVAGMTYTPLATSSWVFAANATLTTGGQAMPLISVTTGVTLTLGDNLAFMASKVMTLTLTGSLNLAGFTVSGNSRINQLLVQSNVAGTSRSVTRASGTFANTDFMDIGVTDAWDASARTDIGDGGGNSGITFPPGATIKYGQIAFNRSYANLPGVSGAYISTQNAAPLQITGNITLDGKFSLANWTPAALMVLIGRFQTVNTRTYELYVDTTGKLAFIYSTNGTAVTTILSTVSTGFSANSINWVRVSFVANDGSGHNTASFYTSSDGSTWSQLGTTVTTAGATSIFAGPSVLEIGSNTLGTASLLVGTAYEARVFNSALGSSSGTPVFDAVLNGAVGTTSFTESSVNAAIVTTNAAGGNHSALANWANNASPRIPLPQDNCNFGVPFAVSQTITADMPRMPGVSWTGATGSPLWAFTSVNTAIYGNVALASGMTTSGTFSTTLAGRGAQTITSAGVTWAQALAVVAPNGTYTLQDALTVARSTAGALTLNSGTLTDNGMTVTLSGANSTFVMTGGVLNHTGTWSLGGTAFGSIWSVTGGTVNSTGTIAIATAGFTNTRTFAGGGKSYGTLQYTVASSPITLILTGADSFANIISGPGRFIIFPSSTVTTIRSVGGLQCNSRVSGLMFLSGVAGNNATTPDGTWNKLTGDFTLDAFIAPSLWIPAAFVAVLGKWNTNAEQYGLGINGSDGKLILVTSANGTSQTTVTSSAATGFTNGTAHWIRVTRTSSTGNVRFWTSSDGVSWTQLGTSQTGATGALFNGSAIVEIGSIFAGTSSLYTGNVFEIRMYSSDLGSGAGTAIFDAQFGLLANMGKNSWQELSSNASTVTVNGGLSQVSDGRVSLVSSSGGTKATLNSPNNQILSGVTVQDIAFGGGGIWYAGHSQSSIVSNVSGLLLTGRAPTIQARTAAAPRMVAGARTPASARALVT